MFLGGRRQPEFGSRVAVAYARLINDRCNTSTVEGLRRTGVPLKRWIWARRQQFTEQRGVSIRLKWPA